MIKVIRKWLGIDEELYRLNNKVFDLERKIRMIDRAIRDITHERDARKCEKGPGDPPVQPKPDYGS